MSKISGLLDPEACATIDAVLAKWAARACAIPRSGLFDQAACVDQAPSDEHRFADTRSQGQRNHDALKAGYEIVHR